MQNYVFYLVWESNSGYTKAQHELREDAEREARRLALKERGKQFFVLKAISHYSVQEVQETILDDPPPF